MIPSPYLTITLPFIFGVLYCLQKYYLRTSRQLRILDLEAKAPLISHFLETIDGLVSIRAFDWTEEFISRFHTLLDASQKPFYLLYCVQRWLTLVLDLTSAGLAVLLVSVTVITRHTASTGFTAVALVNLMTLNLTMMSVVLLWTMLETSLGAVSRIKTFEEEHPAEEATNQESHPPPRWPECGALDFQQVTASYFSNPTPVLRNVSLRIKSGEKVALCGRTGSGKSSIVLALARMIPVNRGSISIDGVDLSNVNRAILRSKLNILPQSPLLIPGTYRLNADLHDVSTDHDIRNALETVGLWEVVEAGGGLDAIMDASTLSVGQKQLFCLARAILRPCQIVILDEATSSVDHETDRKMQQIIRERFADKTVLSITHRVHTVLDFDRVAVLDAGELVECDRPGVLLARSGSMFKALCESSGGGRR